MIAAQGFLNQLVKELNLKSFCEIGYWMGGTMEALQLPNEAKVSVDPFPNYDSDGFTMKEPPDTGYKCKYDLRIMTSDKFFETNERVFDLFLIDGDHTYEQAYRDINNALKFLSPNGVIFCHDAAPKAYWDTQGGTTRCGTAYKALMRKRLEKNDLSVYALNEYNTDPPDGAGFGIIFKQPQEPWKEEIDIDVLDADGSNLNSYKYLTANKELLSFLKFEKVLELIKERNKSL
tara:strand:+ start:663 stop:1361 length:699 start_codon:yes stop_codon:yes gene_type:complete